MMTGKDLVKAIRGMGLKKGDVVLLHSSLNSLGNVEGGADTLIDAFCAVLGKEGALIVPVFGKLGIVTEVLKARKGAVISQAPVGTLAGIGDKAKKLLAGHWDCETAHGEGTPYLKIADAGGYVCLLGVDQDRNTMLHSAEALLRLAYMQTISRTVPNPKGKMVTRQWKFYPGPHRNFIGLDNGLLKAGAMKIFQIGNAQVRLMKARKMLDYCLVTGGENPAFVLCDNPACADCVGQRAALMADCWKKEHFTLVASSRLAGRYVPEMVENLTVCGITAVELDYVQGKPCAFMPAVKLQAYIRELNESGITVTGLRVPALAADPSELAELCKATGISRVILPLACAAKSLKPLAKAGVAVDLANQAQKAVAARETLDLCRKATSCGFVFSPAQFAMAGECPFLRSYRFGKFSQLITQLDLTDALWDGTPARLARGNGEVRELLSILRCRSFSGYVVLGGGAVYPGSLMEAAEELKSFL